MTAVTELAALAPARVHSLAARYGVELVWIGPGEPIPASYWGAPEAGLAGRRLYVRNDTPAHSALHELAHYVCMSTDRRSRLDRDAGGDADEECGVCYLQLLLCAELGVPREQLLSDMDAWGYSFREGSARCWFAGDGRDARRWLLERGLITAAGLPTWRLRER